MIEKILDQLIAGMKNVAPVFYGGLPFELESSQALPCCVFTLESEDAQENVSMNSVLQSKTMSFAITYYVESVTPSELESIREAAHTSIVGYMPDNQHSAIEFRAGSLVESSHHLTQWQDVFAVTSGFKKQIFTRKLS